MGGMSGICSNCYQPLAGPWCPYCDVHTQVTGQAATPSSSSSPSSTQAMYNPGSSSDNAYLPASWDDLQLLYPMLWPTYVANKITTGLLDPSQETDSQTKRNQLGGVAQQINTVVKSCTTLPATDVTNWNQFAQTFLPWFNRTNNTFESGTVDKEQADLLQDQLRGWQIEVSKYCNIGMPVLPKATPTWAELGSDLLSDVGKYFDTIKFVFVLGAGLMLVSVAIIGVDNTRKIVMGTFK
jgi:hypothetical protein